MSRCGDCTLCCKLPALHEDGIVDKPANTWCKHCSIGVGCKIYEQRPVSCKTFQCLWHSNPDFPDELRPDKCHVVLEAEQDSRILIAMVDPDYPDAAAAPMVRELLMVVVAHYGRSVIVLGGDRQEVMLADGMTMIDVMEEAKRILLRQAAEVASRSGRKVHDVFKSMIAG